VPIDPTDLAKSIGALGSLDAGKGLAPTLQLADVARDVTAGQALPTNRHDLAKGHAAKAKSRETRS
jgi:hypothetical protein